MRNDLDWAKEIQEFSTRLKSYFENVQQPGSASSSFSPPADAYEDGDVYRIDVDLPGTVKEDIRITVSNSVVEISGQKRSSRPQGARVLVGGRRYGTFSKRIVLPADADVDMANTTANFENGVLRITLARASKVQGTTIPIS